MVAYLHCVSSMLQGNPKHEYHLDTVLRMEHNGVELDNVIIHSKICSILQGRSVPDKVQDMVNGNLNKDTICVLITYITCFEGRGLPAQHYVY